MKIQAPGPKLRPFRANPAESSSWTPTPIQLQSWPVLIAQQEKQQHKDSTLNLIGISPTGSGKSFSYAIPLALRASSLSLSSSSFVDRKVYGLIITPTRELTIQVSKVVALVCKSVKFQVLQRHTPNNVKDVIF